MDAERLMAIRARGIAARPAPWFVEDLPTQGERRVVRSPWRPGDMVDNTETIVRGRVSRADAVFIAEARSDVDDLVVALDAAWERAGAYASVLFLALAAFESPDRDSVVLARVKTLLAAPLAAQAKGGHQ